MLKQNTEYRADQMSRRREKEEEKKKTQHKVQPQM